MPFFGLWSSRGGQETAALTHSMPARLKTDHPVLPADDISLTLASIPETLYSKRRRPSIGALESPSAHVAKRQKLADGGAVPDCVGAGTSAPPSHVVPAHKPNAATDAARVRDIINNEIGLEILLKHNELRLINQELAKCQIALEQLRRCSLIPYPVNCPTPDQALDIANGSGPALQCYPGEDVPVWAPPFGVVDGPYARHYAKWLIPDPKFDGLQVDFHIERRPRGTEGRTTRNSYLESSHAHARRPVRGAAGQKLQSLSSGYPAKSDKSGPCTLVRAADGVRVKLVCVDCHRENFSSTQGFINHCRIAHKRDYKSHEEAAIHCGHPVTPEPATPAAPALEEKPALVSYPGLVHPFARENIFDQETYMKLKSRIAEAVSMVEAGVHPYCKSIPGSSQPSRQDKYEFPAVVPSARAPFLSKLAEKKGMRTNIHAAVEEATRKVDEDDGMSDTSEEVGELAMPATSSRTAGSMRLPTLNNATAHVTGTTRPASSKGRSTHMPFAGTRLLETVRTPPADDSQQGEDDMEVELSPNTMASNNAPSLVSDDGEYEDSEMMSDSEAGDSLEAQTVSGVPEITTEDEHDPRLMRHHRTTSSVGSEETMRLPKDVKHVTFVSPIKSRTKSGKNGQRRG